MASCTLCSLLSPKWKKETYLTLLEARQHSNMHHSQSRMIMNEADINSSDETFGRCFPGFSESKPCVVKTELSGRDSLIQRCLSLIDERCKGPSPRIDCNECGKRFDRKNMTAANIVRKLVDHACIHSKAELFKCRHCERQFAIKNSAITHLIAIHQIHKSAGHIVENTWNDFIDEISSMIECCFSESGRRDDLVGASESRKSFLQLCHQLVHERNAKGSRRIQCNKCNAIVNVEFMAVVLDHAFSHAENDLYECRLCGCQFRTRTAAKAHVTSIHHIRESISKNIDDKTRNFVPEILTLIKDCFSKDNIGSNSGKAKIRPISEAHIRTFTDGSKLSVERRLFCYRLIRKHADSDRNIQCRLCPKRVSARLRRNWFVSAHSMRHALLHLQKPLARCKQCSKTYFYWEPMQQHLKAKHALPLKSNYECFEDLYHKDILDILKKCYGDETD